MPSVETPSAFDSYGATKSEFSVSPTQKVKISRGNLKYQASTGIWSFSDLQYRSVGVLNSQISPSHEGWIDLFGWGTSGWNSGATSYQPWATSTDSSDYWVGGDWHNDLAGSCENADWGRYNAISNGGNEAGMWRTLSIEEWDYLMSDNAVRAGKWSEATISDSYLGIIVLPDDFALPEGLSFTPGCANGWNTNEYEIAEWNKMELAGAVFLPAAGQREGSACSSSVVAYYWSSTHAGAGRASILYGVHKGMNTTYSVVRSDGLAVRLVKDCE